AAKPAEAPAAVPAAPAAPGAAMKLEKTTASANYPLKTCVVRSEAPGGSGRGDEAREDHGLGELPAEDVRRQRRGARRRPRRLQVGRHRGAVLLPRLREGLREGAGEVPGEDPRGPGRDAGRS